MWTRKEFEKELGIWTQDIIFMPLARDLTILPVLPIPFAIPGKPIGAVKGYGYGFGNFPEGWS